MLDTTHTQQFIEYITTLVNGTFQPGTECILGTNKIRIETLEISETTNSDCISVKAIFNNMYYATLCVDKNNFLEKLSSDVGEILQYFQFGINKSIHENVIGCSVVEFIPVSTDEDKLIVITSLNEDTIKDIILSIVPEKSTFKKYSIIKKICLFNRVFGVELYARFNLISTSYFSSDSTRYTAILELYDPNTAVNNTKNFTMEYSTIRKQWLFL